MFSILTNILVSWGAKLASKKFLGWALLKLAEMYVKSTKTTADDEWYRKIKETLDG